MNINRDYLIINDVKKSNVKLDNGSIFFYITDKNTQNIFVNLVINVSNNDLIQKFANIENAEDYTLTMNIVKPDNTYKIVEGKLHDKENAIFEFNLNEDCCDEIGPYRCELLTKCNINGREEVTTSNKLTYKVKSSVLNDLDDIVEAPEYPLVIQLFDKLSDIEQYEEDRRANELARRLAEEQRQARFNTLDTDMTDRITAMDDKMVDVENRVSTKEQAVDKLIVDTKADIDEYKEAKNQEIDEYKALKDTEIDEAITAQDDKIDTAISNQNDRIAVVENNDTTQNNRLDTLENRTTLHDSRLTDAEAKNQEQDNRLDIVENKNQQQDNRLDVTEAKNVEQDNRLDDIEAIDVAQNTRLDAIEVKNQQQDDRLLDIEKVNKRQDIDLKCLFTEAKNNMMDITEEGNNINLQNSTTGHVFIDEIKGNTLVNCNKEPNKELILNGNINTSGDNTVTLTEGVDGGLVDVALEGNTLVNVSKTKDSTAITKAYTVENSGNHVALQGDVDGSCRPVVTGKTLVNLATQSYLFENGFLDGDTITINSTSDTYGIVNIELAYNLKPNTTYTVFLPEHSTPSQSLTIVLYRLYTGGRSDNKYLNSSGNIFTLTTTSDTDGANYLRFVLNKGADDTFTINKNIIILEGDYTDKVIPDYFTGLQSSFEDNLVTQEMVDSGEEVADNLGKYRVDYKVTGKNKFNNNEQGVVIGAYRRIQIYDKNTNVTVSLYDNDTSVDITGCYLGYIDENSEFKGWFVANGTIYSTMRICENFGSIQIHPNTQEVKDKLCARFNIQIEGDTATAYEPYKEHIKTLYLNSPLLEGDTIEEKNGGIYHVHRYEEVVFDGSVDESWNYDGSTDTHTGYYSGNIKIINYTPLYCDKFKFIEDYNATASYGAWKTRNDEAILNCRNIGINISNSKLVSQDVAGFRKYLQSNPITVLYKLGTPTYELIEQSNLVIPSYANGHLDFNTAVPVEKVDFLPFSEELTYLYANTKYTLQFISDKAITADITLGGTSLLAQSIIKGLNRISITTPENLADNKLVINGVGANISQVVVTDTDREFSYFEGMKSVGECEELEITSANSDNTLSNTQQLNHEPLRAVRGIKDRYVLIDGKWYIERNCREIVLDGSNYTIYPTYTRVNTKKRWAIFNDYSIKDVSSPNQISTINNKYCDISAGDSWNASKEGISQNNSGHYIHLYLEKYSDGSDTSKQSLISELQENPMSIVYQLASPIYEPINYNPLEVYSGTTNITTNSVIPTNITVKNHGFNCLLKPSTTYTISSNLGLNTVTTPAELTEDCLRFMDTDTSDVTTMRDVLVLEGDWTTKADLIPANFSGIESAFEQEYDVEKGKYKVNVKVVGKNLFNLNEDLNIIDTTTIPSHKIIGDKVNITNIRYNGWVRIFKMLVDPNKTYSVSYKCESTTNSHRVITYLNDNRVSDYRKNGSDLITITGITGVDTIYIQYNTTTEGMATFSNIQLEEGSTVTSYEPYKESDVTFYIDEPLRGVGDVKDRVFIKDDKVVVQRNCGIRPYEDGDFGTYPTDKVNTVYQLAEPVYEEVEYNDTKLFIESFKNSTLFYNSNVPVTSKLYYSYSVPIVDTVAQTASISDEQDQLIIDLATQVAVLEMMTM